MNLLHITNCESEFNDLPRIYFCACRDDYYRLHELSDDIFRYAKCSVWYKDEESEEELEKEKIELMSMLLVPVTQQMLITKNYVFEEISSAQNAGIPILPVLLDRGIEEAFNRQFKNIQFIDKNSKDPTAIGYEKKLKAFLDIHILKPEEILKIKQSFESYIFLSYRKKDRKHVKELMQLTHRNSFSRDVAIWYDEFLSVGEDFEEDIKKMMNKSQIMALLVTPNLINEDNYVKEKEYPYFKDLMEKEHVRTVLPIMMEKTDEDQLASGFPGIKTALGKNDYASHLDNALKAAGIRGKNSDPEHLYYIGLAYLYGINMELNGETAVSLLTQSAEMNYIPAICKLVDVYGNGLGVRPNLERAIYYQKKYIDHFSGIITDSTNSEDIEKYISAYGTLCNYLEEDARSQEAAEYGKRIINFAKNRYSALKSNDRSAQIEALKNLVSAYYVSYDNRLIATQEKIVKLDDSEENLRELARAYSIGELSHVFDDDRSVYAEYVKKSADINERLYEKTGKAEYLDSAAFEYCMISEFEKSIECSEKAFEIENKPEYLVTGLKTFGEWRIALSDSGESKETYLKRLDDFWKESERFTDPVVLGKLYTAKQETESDAGEQIKCLKKALDLFESAHDDSFSNVSAEMDCLEKLVEVSEYQAYENQADEDTDAPDRSQILKYRKKILSLHTAMLKSGRFNEYDINLKIAYDNDQIADEYMLCEDYSKALPFCKKAVALREKNDKTAVSDSTADSYVRYARCLWKTGSTENAFLYFDKAIDMINLVIEDHTDVGTSLTVSEALGYALELARETNDTQKEIQYAGEIIETDYAFFEIGPWAGWLDACMVFANYASESGSYETIEKSIRSIKQYLKANKKQAAQRLKASLNLMLADLSKKAAKMNLRKLKLHKALDCILSFKTSQYKVYSLCKCLPLKLLFDLIGLFVVSLFIFTVCTAFRPHPFYFYLILFASYGIAFLLLKLKSKYENKLRDSLRKGYDDIMRR